MAVNCRRHLSAPSSTWQMIPAIHFEVQKNMPLEPQTVQPIVQSLHQLSYPGSSCSIDKKVTGSNPGRGKRSFSSLKRPDRLCGPPSLLLIRRLGSFSGGKAAGAWNLATHLRPAPRLILLIIIIIIIIIIFIHCNWVVTRWQWLFYMYTNMKNKVTRKFK